MPQKTLLYVGTFTRSFPYLGVSNGKGIYVYESDTSTGKLIYLRSVEDIDSPSYLAIDSHNLQDQPAMWQIRRHRARHRIANACMLENGSAMRLYQLWRFNYLQQELMEQR